MTPRWGRLHLKLLLLLMTFQLVELCDLKLGVCFEVLLVKVPMLVQKGLNFRCEECGVLGGHAVVLEPVLRPLHCL